jgi:hypothetical protein
MARVCHLGSSMVAQPFTPADRRRLIERTAELLGRKKVAALIERHRNDRTSRFTKTSSASHVLSELLPIVAVPRPDLDYLSVSVSKVRSHKRTW